MIKRADTAGLGACRLSCSGEAIRRCQFWALHSNTWIKSVKSLWQNRISDPVRKQPLEKLSKIRMEVKLKWGAEKCQPFRFNSNLFSLQQITRSTATSFPPLIFPPGWDQPCAFCLFGREYCANFPMTSKEFGTRLSLEIFETTCNEVN